MSIGAATSTQCLLPSAHIQLVHASDDAEKLYAAAMDERSEGIVAKRKDSIYLSPVARSSAWQKIESRGRAHEFVVGGCHRGQGARASSGGALLLGCWPTRRIALRRSRRLGSR